MKGKKMLIKSAIDKLIARKKVEHKVRKVLEKHTIKSLCKMFEATNHPTGCTVKEAMFRGWITDELEKRDQKSFNRWISCNDSKLADSPSCFFNIY